MIRGCRRSFPTRRSPGLLLQLLLLTRGSGKSGERAPGTVWRGPGARTGGEGRLQPRLSSASRILASGRGRSQGEEGWGRGWEVSLLSPLQIPALSPATRSL